MLESKMAVQMSATFPSTRPETASSAIHSAFQQLKVTFPALKDEQEEAAVAILQGKDVFVQLPTGYGKTMILALLPFAFDFFLKQPLRSSLVLCLSPLIALMADQCKRLQNMGLEVAVVSGQLQNCDMLTGSHGKHQILILSPEMAINNDNVRQCIQKLAKRIVSVVINEAHCIAFW
jgi:bloom syndrome protein